MLSKFQHTILLSFFLEILHASVRVAVWVNFASALTLPSLGTKQFYVYDLKGSYLEDVLTENKQNRVNVFGNYIVPK